MHSEHLIFAFATKTTGPDYEVEEILEMAAVVVLPPSLKDEIFQSKLQFHCLVRPTKEITNQVTKRTGIKREDVENELGFFEAFKSFMDWVQSVVREGRRLSPEYLITGLVSHFGYWSDFRFLVNETARYFPKSIEDVIGLWCKLGDSWELISRLKKTDLIDKNVKTNLPDLYKRFCGEELTASRAIDEAQALAKILSSSHVQAHIQLMDFLTFSAFKVWFEKELLSRIYLDDLLDHFGLDSISMDLLRDLSYKQISYQKVNNVYWRSKNHVRFGVKMKSLYEMNLTEEEAKEIYRACSQNQPFCSFCICTQLLCFNKRGQ